MCTIIGGRFNSELVDEEFVVTVSYKNIETIERMLNTKGGDYYSYIIFSMEDKPTGPMYKRFDRVFLPIYSGINMGEFKADIGKISTIRSTKENSVYFLFFSRLTPETESEHVKIPQPYKTINGNYIIAHGTIPLKDDTLVEIDTEIFRYDLDIETSIKKAETLNGKVSLIYFDLEEEKIKGIHNGLGLWEVKCDEMEILTNINIKDLNIFHLRPTSSLATEPSALDSQYIEPYVLTQLNFTSSEWHRFTREPINIKEPRIVFSLCSGGMDTMMSTYQHIDALLKLRIPIKEVILAYYDWGTRASNQEKAAVEKFKNFLTDRYPTFEIMVSVFNAKAYFNEVFQLAGIATKARLCDEDAVGKGHEEAEEAISYVPLRNTRLVLNAVSILETNYPGQNASIVIGANLTEGMVYGDNSTNYIEKLNSLIKIAGQKTYGFEVVAPFKNVTKTKMLETMWKVLGPVETVDLLEMSFSCYFPEDGKACGKCGSCLLKHESTMKLNRTMTMTVDMSKRLNKLCGWEIVSDEIGPKNGPGCNNLDGNCKNDLEGSNESN